MLYHDTTKINYMKNKSNNDNELKKTIELDENTDIDLIKVARIKSALQENKLEICSENIAQAMMTFHRRTKRNSNL